MGEVSGAPFVSRPSLRMCVYTGQQSLLVVVLDQTQPVLEHRQLVWSGEIKFYSSTELMGSNFVLKERLIGQLVSYVRVTYY